MQNVFLLLIIFEVICIASKMRHIRRCNELIPQLPEASFSRIEAHTIKLIHIAHLIAFKVGLVLWVILYYWWGYDG